MLAKWRLGTIALVLLMAGAADASPVTCTAGATVPPANLSVSTACENFSGNDLGKKGVVKQDPFATSTWQLAATTTQKGILGSGASKPDKSFIFTVTGISAGAGTWAAVPLDGLFQLMITISNGKNYAAFLVNTDFLSGFWSTLGLFDSKKKKVCQHHHCVTVWVPSKNIHLSLWYNPEVPIPPPVPPPPPPVPLPPAALLFLTGLGGLGGTRMLFSRLRARAT